MNAKITLDGEAGDLVRDGKLLFIGLIFFDPGVEEMRVLFSGDQAESMAMLRKYGMIPGDAFIRKGA